MTPEQIEAYLEAVDRHLVALNESLRWALTMPVLPDVPRLENFR